VIRQSASIAGVQSPVIPIVGRWIAETPGTISLGQGVVSYGPPPEALAAARRFPESSDDHKYGPVEGVPALVAALEEKLRDDNGVALWPDSRLVVTAGGNMAFVNAVFAIGDPGDEFILCAPFYFNHDMAIRMASCRTVAVPTTRDYQLDVDAIADAVTPRTRAIVTVSPNNPTGAMYRESALREVNALCERRGLFHIHDEAYEYFTYGEVRHFSPGSIAGAARHTISLYSLSKSYGFASWRIGYMVAPESLWDAINKIQDTVLICPTAIAQQAALGAIRVGGDYARGHLARLDRMRALMRSALTGADVPCDATVPFGAFYYFLRVHTRRDPLWLTEQLIRQHRVAVIPGSAFGALDGCYLRVSYGALDEQTAAEGVGRLVAGLKALVADGES